jgi:hypothetical protein
MLREEIDKLFREAYELESCGNKNEAYHLYKETVEKVRLFKKLAPPPDHMSIDGMRF